ncbi:hypothetical protein DINM_001879 [Dirofilaria immitis]|nr:hypothetical protein [Dirofilaria immitis]
MINSLELLKLWQVMNVQEKNQHKIGQIYVSLAIHQVVKEEESMKMFTPTGHQNQFEIAWDETYKLGFNVTRHCDSGRMLIFICYYFPSLVIHANMTKIAVRKDAQQNLDCAKMKKCSLCI